MNWAPVRISYGNVGIRPSQEVEVAAIKLPTEGPETIATRLPFTLNFVPGHEEIVFKLDGPRLYALSTAVDGGTVFDWLNIENMPNSELQSRVRSPGTSWLYAPLALNQVGGRRRAAWLGAAHIWVAEGDKARQKFGILHDRSLLGGDISGTRLQFTSDGTALIALQQSARPGPVKVRIWDLRQEYHEWLDTAAVPALKAVACKLIEAEGIVSETERRTGLSDEEIELFALELDDAEPCTKPKGST